jgi:hypothetical protein
VLLYSLDGIFKPPHSRTSAFSKANWGDYNTQTQHGLVLVEHASLFLKRIKSIKDKQWEDIYQAAWDAYEGSKPKPGQGEIDVDDIGDSSSDDAELFDLMYNEVA